MLSRLKRWGALILGVFSALSWLITAWFRRKVKKTEEKLEEVKEDARQAEQKAKQATNQTERVIAAVKQSNETEQKLDATQETNEQIIQEADDEEILDFANSLVDSWNNKL